MGATESKAAVDAGVPTEGQDALHEVQTDANQQEEAQSQTAVETLHEHLLSTQPAEQALVCNDSDTCIREGLADSDAFCAQKGMRTMGLEALLLLPKLALTEVCSPTDIPMAAHLPRGPRAAAERVRQHRNQHPSMQFTSCVNRYRSFLLRERLQELALEDRFKATVTPSQDSLGTSVAAEVKHADGADEEFDFLSLPSLAAMNAGICIRPSWKELAAGVGTVDSLRQLLLQLQDERLQIKKKLKRIKGEQESCRRDTRGSRNNSGGVGGACSANTEAYQGRKAWDAAVPLAETAGTAEKSHCPHGDIVTLGQAKAGSRGIFGDCESKLPPYTEEILLADHQLEQGKDPEWYEASLAAIIEKQERKVQEAAHLQAECLELDEDIGILHRACSELEALMKRVWDAEKLPKDARIERSSFRRLWCYPQDDPQQTETADKLFALCLSNSKRRHRRNRNVGTDLNVSTGATSVPPHSLVCATAGETDGSLGFNELLEQLPPKALECLWCSAELRRKERQNYRYFWI